MMEATTKAGHTPGPWRVDLPGGHEQFETDASIIAGERRLIAEVALGFDADVDAEQRANARLIAQAPTLLAAARLGHADSPGLPAGDLLAAANALRNSGYASLAKRLERKHDAESAAIAAATGEGE